VMARYLPAFIRIDLVSGLDPTGAPSPSRVIERISEAKIDRAFTRTHYLFRKSASSIS